MVAFLLSVPAAGAFAAGPPSATATETPTDLEPVTRTHTVSPTVTPTSTEYPPYLVVDRNVFSPALGDRVQVHWVVATRARVQIRIYNSAGEVVVGLVD